MNCKICHKQVIEHTSKTGNIYKVNPLDKSPHRARKNEEYVCVYSWDEFIEVMKLKQNE